MSSDGATFIKVLQLAGQRKPLDKFLGRTQLPVQP